MAERSVDTADMAAFLSSGYTISVSVFIALFLELLDRHACGELRNFDIPRHTKISHTTKSQWCGWWLLMTST